MTRQTHLRGMTLICQMTVIIDVSDAKKEPPEIGSDQTMRNFNGKIADNSVQVKDY